MSAATSEVRRLNSPGPISDAFMLSRAFVVVIIGPVGSSKTVSALRKNRRNGQRQRGRVDAQGRTWRRARCGVIRESYPNIEKNTLPSWFRIHAESDGKFGWRAPYSHNLRLIQAVDDQDQATDICDLEMEFRAIGDKSVEEACRGWEVNSVMIDEADLQPPELLSFLSGRVGRFSDLDPEMVVDPQIILSLNAPYTDNWVYRMAVEPMEQIAPGQFRLREGEDAGGLFDPEVMEALGGRPLIETFIQPGGREPGAENLHNLPGGRGYYVIQAALNKHRPGYVERMIDNKFVPMQHGQPVNPQFSYSEHVRPLEWDKRRKLIVGLDQGLYAAAVATQRTVEGGLRSLAEQVQMREDGKTLRKIGASAFGAMVRTMLAERFPDVDPHMLRFVLDPAAFAADDREDDEHDWVLAFSKGLGARVHKARSNAAALRNEAIWKAMDEREGYAIDPKCKNLIRAHLGGYHYRKAEISDGETRGHLEIADTIYTHVADAEQYAALEGEGVIADIRGKEKRRKPVKIVSDYNELGGW